MSIHKPNLIIALDKMNQKEVKDIIQSISEQCGEYMESVIFKVNDVLASIGFQGLQEVFRDVQGGIMLDGKWHDIGNTNANYLEQLANYPKLASKIEYITMHASSGQEGLEKAIKTRHNIESLRHIKILAVTALTNLTDGDTKTIFDENRRHSVLKLAQEALKSGVDGIVCSPKEAQVLRDVYSEKYPNFLIITPGVRFVDGENHDQKNVESPRMAAEKGSNGIVMGRPILESQNVRNTVRRFFEEIEGVGYCSDEQRNIFEKLLYTGEWMDLLKYIGAIYSSPKNGALCRLTSGLLSNVYGNMAVCEAIPEVANQIAVQLSKKIIQELNIPSDEAGRSDYVIVGAQAGSVRVSGAVGGQLGIKSIYAEKRSHDSKKILIGKDGFIYERKLERGKEELYFGRHDGGQLKGKKVIITEDAVNRGASTARLVKIIEAQGGEVVGISCIWNRHGQKVRIIGEEKYPIISLLETPEDFANHFYDNGTPLEARGIYPLAPQGREVVENPKHEWKRLIDSMNSQTP